MQIGNKININYFISNLNIILIFVGYPLVTTLFMGFINSSANSTSEITIPFRMFSLLISTFTLLLNVRTSNKLPLHLKVFIFFWLLLLVRIYFDLEIQTDYHIPQPYKTRVWLFAVAICFIPMLSVIKSINVINYNICIKYIYIVSSIILIISFFTSMKGTSSYDRIDANKALDSISFGLIGITTSILSIYYLSSKSNHSRINKIIYFFTLILGLYIALRTGSRGPILALLIVLIFWFSFKSKRNSKSIINLTTILFILFISFNFIIYVISFISPITSKRIIDGINGDDLSISYRQDSYLWFIQNIKQSPIYGSHFARLENGEYPGYAHNIFLDILLGFGILGLILFISVSFKSIKNTIKSIRENNNEWIGLLFILYFILSLSSGAYYANPILNCLIIMSLLLPIIKTNKHK